MVLLKAFADAHPHSFEFIQPEDFVHFENEAFRHRGVGPLRWALSLLLCLPGAVTYTGSLQTAGFPAGIGAAPNAEAALLLARSTEKIVCADRDSVRGKLARVSTSLLPCETTTRGVLSRWGIRTLGELAALPETALVTRLGQQGRRLQLLSKLRAIRASLRASC